MKNKLLFFFAFSCFLSGVDQLIAQSQWDARLVLNRLDCQNRRAWYTLELRSSSDQDWALADQNYHFFYDGDLMTVKSVRSLLPSDAYSAANIDQNLKIFGQGQEDYSPLNNIDDHLGFLDFSIVRKEKSNIAASLRLQKNKFTAIAEMVMDIDAVNLNSLDLKNALSLYFSRKTTAGKITKQYTVITEHEAVNYTRTTQAGKITDLTYEQGVDAQLAIVCKGVVKDDFSHYQILTREAIEGLLKGELEIYPNPANDFVRYRTPGLQIDKHTILIFDQFNRLIRSWERSAAEEENTVVIEDLPSGVYLFMIETEGVQLKKQLVKLYD